MLIILVTIVCLVRARRYNNILLLLASHTCHSIISIIILGSDMGVAKSKFSPDGAPADIIDREYVLAINIDDRQSCIERSIYPCSRWDHGLYTPDLLHANQ